MHELRDENGNLIPHGGAGHAHDGEHSHGAEHPHGTEHQSGEKKDPTLALLTYLVDHNEHHAADLSEMADKIEKEGREETAMLMKEGVKELEKGNALLARALESYQASTKEA